MRKIVANCCIDLSYIQNPYHCKRQDFDVMVEKLNGTLLIACSAWYDETKGGYGQSFEENMSEASISGARLVTYKLAKMDLGNLTCAIRFEVDAVNEIGELVELKSMKYHRYGLENKDYFLLIWIQMVLSNTPNVKIGIHINGLISEISSYSMEDVQRMAGLHHSNAKVQLFQNLNNILSMMYSQVEEGRQATVKFFSQSSSVQAIELKVYRRKREALPCHWCPPR